MPALRFLNTEFEVQIDFEASIYKHFEKHIHLLHWYILHIQKRERKKSERYSSTTS